MESHEVLRTSVDRVGVKKVAGALDVSSSLVYKWCQPPGKDDEDGSGVNNPIDRLLKIYETTADLDIIHHVCRKAGGYFTPNPLARTKEELAFVTESIEILNKFADLMHFAERALRDDGTIDEKENAHIRRDWDKLKSRLEHFVVCCENGLFDLKPKAK